MQDAKVNPNVYDHVHMKLFRSQRNLYISGFSLFLWLSVTTHYLLCNNSTKAYLLLFYRIMRRVVTLLNQVAATLDDNAGLHAQMDGAAKATKLCQDDNLLLKQASPVQAHLKKMCFLDS